MTRPLLALLLAGCAPDFGVDLAPTASEDVALTPELREAARRLAPIVQLHPEDPYGPAGVDWTLAQRGEGGALPPEALAGQGAEAPAYVRFATEEPHPRSRRSEPWLRIEYWLFFPASGQPEGWLRPVAEQGDWEKVELLLDPESLLVGQLGTAYVSSCGRGCGYTVTVPGGLFTEGRSWTYEYGKDLNADRIEVFAALQTHDTTPFEGELLSEVWLEEFQYAAPGGLRWDTRDTLVFLDDAAPTWMGEAVLED